ncbi:MAG: hypothetical protein JL50_11295 [Peptococcaceae bacterium BICA1-7]|nr:MAG: hypothetical protein JL50_11295 [Peptococcaceae bacterium BICA1-7]
MVKNVYIIGAGQLGSRHLQAIKLVDEPLDIKVIDPSTEALKVAQERYLSVNSEELRHKIEFAQKIEIMPSSIEFVIIATNSDVRKNVVQELMEYSNVRYLLLEKLLFTRKEDYYTVDRLLSNNGTKAWVNCPMRMMPFYKRIKELFRNRRVFYHVSGSSFGLITNAIHYIDHIAYLSDCYEYRVDTSFLEPVLVPSKRKGFQELNGTLEVSFENGSRGMLTCYSSGNAPLQVEIFSDEARCIVRESEGKAWVSSKEWLWEEVDARIPYQSEMTVEIFNSIYKKGSCPLVTYQDSMKLHLPILEALKDYINKYTGKKYDYYPFT